MHAYQCKEYVYVFQKVMGKIVLEDTESLLKNKGINRQLSWFHWGKVLPY